RELQLVVALEFLQCGQQGRLHFARSAGVVQLLPVAIGDVKDVDDLVEMRGDLRQLDRQPQVENLTRESVQQPGAIVGKNVDDREPFRGTAVNYHSGGQIRNGLRPPHGAETPVTLKQIFDQEAAGKRFSHCRGDIVDAVRRHGAGKVAIEDAERVEHKSFGGGADLGRDDLQVVCGQHAGRFVKAAGHVPLVRH